MKALFFMMAVMTLIFFSGCQPKKSEKTTAATSSADSLDFVKANGKLTPEILWKFGRINPEIQLSPDKKTILYEMTRYNLAENNSNTDLFIQPAKGGEAINLTNTPDVSESNAQWRPDGKKIGFLAPDDSSWTQIWEMNPDGSGKIQISSVIGGINGFKYAPDMSKVLYIKDVKLDKTPNEIYPDLPLAEARIIDDMMYRHWNAWHDFAYSHIFIADVKNGKVEEGTDIMENERFDCPMHPFGGMEQINWSPDSKKIAYACKKMTGKQYTLSTNSEIYLYNLDDKTTVNISEPGFDGYDFDPVFSPDGKLMAWKSMEEDGFESDKERVIVYDFSTGKATDISKDFDYSSSHFVFSDDSKTLYFISGIQATHQICKADLGTGKITQITSGDHDYQSFEVGPDFLIGTKMSLSHPTEIYSISLSDGKETQTGHTNDWIFEKISMGKVVKRWIKTTDNKQMLTWVVLPPDFDSSKKYPALLYCQGGPQSAVSQFFSYRWNLQIMAANGYVVVAPNRRGLPSFGEAWNDQISGDYGGQNMKDYLSAIDDVSKEPWIDKEHLGAVGASYGGFSVFYLAGNHQKRFKAFIAHCGMFNLESQYASTDEYWFVNKDLEGPYWEKKNSFKFSPHLYVKNWDTPILITTGENDFRIPYTESLQAFNTAQLLGIPSKLIVFPKETHFILKPQNSVLWQREFFAWLDKYLKVQ